MSDYNSPYDPTAPDGDANRGSSYISKRDIKVIGVVLVILGVALYPIYKNMERSSQSARCAQNMKSISTAINEYATLHDDRFPPIMRTLTNGSPDLGQTGMPYTWASDIDEHMSPRANFLCPTASSDEIVKVEGPHNKVIPLTYGMYAPYGGYLRSIIDSPDETVIVAESSNNGAGTTFDPVKFTDNDEKPMSVDGFVLGWDDSNLTPSEKSNKITRLAFPETADGEFKQDGHSRHDLGIHAISASGAALPLLKPRDAVVTKKFGLPGGRWAVPPISGMRRKPAN